jgi:hypothetical protein
MVNERVLEEHEGLRASGWSPVWNRPGPFSGASVKHLRRGGKVLREGNDSPIRLAATYIRCCSRRCKCDAGPWPPAESTYGRAGAKEARLERAAASTGGG